MLAGIGENAGVLDIGQGYAVTFKVESHNHPSYVEPYQGAATGVGGIVRDILAMGARPVAVMDPLRFGPLDAPDTHRVLPGIVAGVGGYGNCLGLPNIGGEAVFDETYLGNPLVNALCVGVLRHEDLHLAKASGVGNQVILYGARTGGDGIGGVSVLASETFDADGPAKRPSVQVGDPFMEKLLIECTLEIFAAGLVAGIQDLGGAGLSCATSELASAGDGGMHVELDRVPLRDSTLSPEEILMSESQERMMAVVEPDDVAAFLAICAKWDVEAVVVGEVTDTGRLQIDWHGERVVDVPPRSVAHDGPTYQRPFARPGWQDALQADAAEALARPATGDELRETLLRLVASPNLCDKSWITDQYDRYVRGNTVLAQPSDSGMIRVDEETNLGVAVSTDCNGRFAKLDPYAGAQLALAESYRNVATGGATPLAISDCLNFGSPGGPGRDVAVRGGLPRAQGRLPRAGHPGHRRQRQPLQPDRRHRDPADPGGRRPRRDRGRHPAYPVGLGAAGERVFLLGETREELSGSEWAHVVHGHLGGRPPARRPRRREGARGAAARGRRPAHQRARPLRRRPRPGAGRGGRCATTSAPRSTCPADAFLGLFAESAGRVLVTVAAGDEDRLADLAARHGVAVTELGTTGGADRRRRGPVRGTARHAPRGLDRHPAGRARVTGPRWTDGTFLALPGLGLLGASLAGCGDDEAGDPVRTRERRGERRPAHGGLRRGPEPVRRAVPARGHAARRRGGDPRRLLEGGLRPVARASAGQRAWPSGAGPRGTWSTAASATVAARPPPSTTSPPGSTRSPRSPAWTPRRSSRWGTPPAATSRRGRPPAAASSSGRPASPSPTSSPRPACWTCDRRTTRGSAAAPSRPSSATRPVPATRPPTPGSRSRSTCPCGACTAAPTTSSRSASPASTSRPRPPPAPGPSWSRSTATTSW